MNPETGNFHPIVKDEDLRSNKHQVTERQAQNWIRFQVGETVIVKGAAMRITEITRTRLIVQPVQQLDKKDSLKRGIPNQLPPDAATGR